MVKQSMFNTQHSHCLDSQEAAVGSHSKITLALLDHME